MEDVELRIVAELMKNSHRSDRELARVIGVSQPTVTRIRTRLEEEGIIREYTVIPDYVKLGFQLMSMTFARLKGPLSTEALGSVRKTAYKMLKERPTAAIIAMSGMGCNADRVVVAFHRNYSEYEEFTTLIRQYPPVVVDEVKSFLIDPLDKSQFQPLTFSRLADYLLRVKENP